MRRKISYFTCFLSWDDLECIYILWRRGLLGDLVFIRNFPWRDRSWKSVIKELFVLYFLIFLSKITFRRIFIYKFDNSKLNKNFSISSKLEPFFFNTVSELSSSYFVEDPKWQEHRDKVLGNLESFTKFLSSTHKDSIFATFNGRNVFAQVIKNNCRFVINAERQSYNLKAKIFWTRITPCNIENMAYIARIRLKNLRENSSFNWHLFYKNRSMGIDGEGKRFVNTNAKNEYAASEVLAFTSNLFESFGTELSLSEVIKTEDAFFDKIKQELINGKSVTLRIHPNSMRLTTYAIDALNSKIKPLFDYEKFTLIDKQDACYVYDLFADGQKIIAMGSTIAVEALFHARNLNIEDVNPNGTYNALLRVGNLSPNEPSKILEFLSTIASGFAYK